MQQQQQFYFTIFLSTNYFYNDNIIEIVNGGAQLFGEPGFDSTGLLTHFYNGILSSFAHKNLKQYKQYTRQCQMRVIMSIKDTEDISRLVNVTVEEYQINTPTCSPGAFIRQHHARLKINHSITPIGIYFYPLKDFLKPLSLIKCLDSKNPDNSKAIFYQRTFQE